MAKDAAEALADRLKKHCSDNGRDYCDPIIWLYDFSTGVIGEELEMTPGVTKVFPAKPGERLKAMVAITEYLYPKQKAVVLSGDPDHPMYVAECQFNIVDADKP